MTLCTVLVFILSASRHFSEIDCGMTSSICWLVGIGLTKMDCSQTVRPRPIITPIRSPTQGM